jgi:hypothetical protein
MPLHHNETENGHGREQNVPEQREARTGNKAIEENVMPRVR